MAAGVQLDGGVTGDAELIASVRSGDTAAVGALYERHAGAAWVVARQYSNSPADAEDVVADAFAAVFGALQRGNGPDAAFRAYLFTVVRRVAGLRREKARRVEPTDDIAVLEAGTALAGTAEDPALAGFERGVVARAFHSLPERWQAVLWHTEVEGLAPAEIAPILGLTANSVAALAYRAREGLRQAYLQQHLQDPLDDRCRSIAGKLGAYVRGGLGTRETAQVSTHLEDCGNCRGLLFELGDVNHGMKAVIAPLVLGLAGLGALGVVLPVGGGLAAGAAAATASAGAGAGVGAGGAGAGGAGAGAGGAGVGGAAAGGGGAAAAGGGAVAATAVATGAVGVVGAGTAAATTSVAAILAAIPLGAAAIAVGSVALVVAAAVGITTLIGEPEAIVAAPTATSSTAPSTASPEPTSTAGSGATPKPTDLPTPEPTELSEDDDFFYDDDESVQADDMTAADDADADSTADLADPVDPDPADPTDPAAPVDPVDPAEPVDPVDPPTPADVAVDLPAAGLRLEAGLSDQVLEVGVRNTGGTAATGLVAEVVLPDGVTLAGVATGALERLPAGGFAGPAAPGWVCAMGAGTSIASCTLDRLPALSVSTLMLSVSIDESYDRSDGEIQLRVQGTGISYVARPIPVAISASPARLTLRSTPATIPLVSTRTHRLDLAVANVGGTAIPAGQGSVTAFLPDDVTAVAAPGSGWTCGTARPLTCAPGAVGPRADAPLSLLLAADTPSVADGTLSLQLTPAGRRVSETITVPFTVQSPATLIVDGPASATVALGTTAVVPTRITNTGELPADGVQVTVQRPASLAFGEPAVADPAWSCGPDGTTVVCTAAQIGPGATLDLPLDVRAVAGAFGALDPVTVTASAPGAVTGQHGIAVTAQRPVLALDAQDPYVLLDATGAGTARFTVHVSGADAMSTRATLRLPTGLNPAPDWQRDGCTVVYREVRCEWDNLAAGASEQILVNVEWAGSTAGMASVVVRADGATDVSSSSTVRTSSAGLSARDSYARANVTEVGAPVLTCGATVAGCASALQNGDRDNNAFAMVPLDEAAPGGPRGAVPVSSTARLVIPTDREVVFAGLYWSANRGPNDAWSDDLTTARLRGPGGEYVDVTASTVVERSDNSYRRYYQSFADVTDQVNEGRTGDWSVADIAVGTGSTDKDRTYYGGWSLVVVYSDSSSDASVTVYDGAQWIGTSGTTPAFEFASDAGTRARIGVVAWEGDRTSSGDRLLLGDTCSSSTAGRPLVPLRNGSVGSGTNAFDSTATGWRLPNSLGVDVKAFQEVTLACDVSSLTATTTGDQYLIGAITLRSAPAVGTPQS